jgi:hypothetical protein
MIRAACRVSSIESSDPVLGLVHVSQKNSSYPEMTFENVHFFFKSQSTLTDA